MQNHSTRKRAQGSTSKNRQPKANPLARYEAQAAPILRLRFGSDAPAFVRDYVSSWLSELENCVQLIWNSPEILGVALPLMLREAERMGLDVTAADSPVSLDACQSSINVNSAEGEE